MKRKLILLIIIGLGILYARIHYGQTTFRTPEVLWTKVIGSPDTNELARCVQETRDGGYILVGSKGSLKKEAGPKRPWGMEKGLRGKGKIGMGKGRIRAIKESENELSGDLYLVKTDANGNVLWEKTYGGKEDDGGFYVQETSDTGYIIAGSTEGSGRETNADVYLIKTDASGNIQWERKFGGPSLDRAQWVQETSDGGYILVGVTSSFGAGQWDIYLIKTDPSGNKLWEKTFGDQRMDWGYSVRETQDGGYIIAGIATAGFGRKSPKEGKLTQIANGYVIKTDGSGNPLWEKRYGGARDVRPGAIHEVSDGYVITGTIDPLVSNENDFYILKIDKSGNVIWERSIGVDDRREWCFKSDLTSDGRYILCGETQIGPLGYESDLNVYAVRTDKNGNVLWTKEIIGGTGAHMNDWARGVQQTRDGGYILAGMRTAPDRTKDIFLIKLGPDK